MDASIVSDAHYMKLQNANSLFGVFGPALLGVGLAVGVLQSVSSMETESPVLISLRSTETTVESWLMEQETTGLLGCLSAIHRELTENAVQLDSDARAAIYNDLWDLYT